MASRSRAAPPAKPPLPALSQPSPCTRAAAFRNLLSARQAGGGRSIPAPAPIDGPAWAATSAMQKRLRLRDQIEWAERERALAAVFEFLLALPDDQWHHFD